MERVLIICAILAFQFIQAEPTGPCECNDHTEKGKRDSLLGRCLKTSSNCPDSGTWCYIDDNSKCEDAKKSKKADVPYRWSCHACRLQEEDTLSDGAFGSFPEESVAMNDDSSITFPGDETESPEPFFNINGILGQPCQTKTFLRRSECSTTCGDGSRSVERVVEIVKPKTGLGKCNVNPGTELLPPEPCNTGIPCPTSEAPGSGFGGRSGVEEEGTFGDWTETEDCPQACPRFLSPVCGSDGKTYDNGCELQMADCDSDNTITKKHQGKCTDKERGLVDKNGDLETTGIIIIVVGAALVLACLAGVCCCCGCCLQKICSSAPSASPPSAPSATKKKEKKEKKSPLQPSSQSMDQQESWGSNNDNRREDSFFYDDVENYDNLP